MQCQAVAPPWIVRKLIEKHKGQVKVNIISLFKDKKLKSHGNEVTSQRSNRKQVAEHGNWETVSYIQLLNFFNLRRKKPSGLEY